MDWMILLMASAFEIAFALGLKTTYGFSRLWPSVVTVVAGVVSFVLLSFALKTLPVGSGYAAWTGIGAVGSTILGILLFGESREASRLVSLTLIVAGIVGLRLSTPDTRRDQPDPQQPATSAAEDR